MESSTEKDCGKEAGVERRIGFVGCYSHDVILMVAKVLGCLSKKVLIRDQNRQHTLLASIPVPEGLSITTTKVEYDGFFFTGQEEVLDDSEDFDIEIVDFGMDINVNDSNNCSELFLITDMLLHHIRRLEKTGLINEKVSICILRDAFEDTCKKEKEVKIFLQSFPNGAEYFLPPDYRDARNRYVCETLHEYSICRASPEMQDIIYGIASKLYPEYSEKEIKRRVKQQERRRYR